MNSKHDEQIENIKNEFLNSRKILNAVCDENRQKILLVLMDNCVSGGVRVNDIAKSVNLSRPAVSHHLKLLMDENIVSVQKDGTKNYYHITGGSEILKLKNLINCIEEFMNDEVKDL